MSFTLFNTERTQKYSAHRNTPDHDAGSIEEPIETVVEISTQNVVKPKKKNASILLEACVFHGISLDPIQCRKTGGLVQLFTMLETVSSIHII